MSLRAHGKNNSYRLWIQNNAINKLLVKRWLFAPLWLALADCKYPSRFQISAACRKWGLEVGGNRNCWHEQDAMQILAFIIKLNEADGYTKYDLGELNYYCF